VATQVTTVVGPVTFDGRAATRLTIAETIQTSGETDQLFSGSHHVALNNEAVQLLGTVSSFDQQYRYAVNFEPTPSPGGVAAV
jgi:patatin-like phospholipase/acyl hydrolase